jgi:hypothetical protein
MNMSYDVARLRRVMKTIETKPETFDMEIYAEHTPSCGTTMCLAGHVVVDEGLVLDWRGDVVSEAWHLVGGRSIFDAARDLLGFSVYEAHEIFLATDVKTANELWDVITGVTGIERTGADS